jgi:hypothetical protein
VHNFTIQSLDISQYFFSHDINTNHQSSLREYAAAKVKKYTPSPCVFSETHGKGCMTDICPVKDLCRAFFVARTAMNLCRASGTAHDEKRSLTARPYETASDGFARTLSCAWTHDKQN